jgi:hypothetical protein
MLNKNFYGYESKEKLLNVYPNFPIDDKKIIREDFTVCSNEKKCRGSFFRDSKEVFIYWDGTEDFGRIIKKCSLTIANEEFQWFEE